MNRGIGKEAMLSLLNESRNQCAICGSDVAYHLELAHIKAMYLGGLNTSENMIVLCSACHAAVDSLAVPYSLLKEIKQDWIEKGILGAKSINQLLSTIIKGQQHPWTFDSVPLNFLHWANTLKSSRTLDLDIEEAQARLQAVKNEDEFISIILFPLFIKLGFENVTVIHHSSEHEHGKDMVFLNRDPLGSFTVYAVVASSKKIHAASSKTSDSGHYAKLIDQVKKCYSIEWRDHHLKRDTFIDKVVIATPSTITYEAMMEFQSWEEANKRQLIYLNDQRLAGIMAGLKLEY